MYEKPQFEAAFQLVTAVSHQIIKIDFAEMEVWIDKLMSAKGLDDPEVKRNHENLKAVMQQYRSMQEVLMVSGVPVRDISHYKEATAEAAAIIEGESS
jgi:hypothetical protein